MESTEISREDKPKSMTYSKTKLSKRLIFFFFFGKQNVMTSMATWITPSDPCYGEHNCCKMEYNPHTQRWSVPRSLITRDASVFEVLCYANGRIFWDLQFRRLVNDQESQSLDSCMGLIYSTKVRGVGSDKFSWKLASSRGFVVSGYYHSLFSSTITSFPWKFM